MSSGDELVTIIPMTPSIMGMRDALLLLIPVGEVLGNVKFCFVFLTYLSYYDLVLLSRASSETVYDLSS